MPRPWVLEWRGRLFEGQRAVAQAAGVSEKTVCWHLRQRGNLDALGVGRGRWPGRADRCRRQFSKPVQIGARRWPSIKALADEIGRNPKAVRKWIAAGNTDRVLRELMDPEKFLNS